MSKFSERLKELREEAKLTQMQLSKALGKQISATAIGYWELEKRTPNMEALIILARFFKVSLDYLVGLED